MSTNILVIVWFENFCSTLSKSWLLKACFVEETMWASAFGVEDSKMTIDQFFFLYNFENINLLLSQILAFCLVRNWMKYVW